MKSKHHEVDFQAFQEWLAEAEIVFASSTRERKRLVCKVNGNIQITVAGQVVWRGVQPFLAVEAYNAITEKYISDNILDFKL